ncbi:translation initiation factor IF-2 [Globicephala melas]|uniref:translation initiation factor IF-2 n=1 Tax=Globicephala melas TaxID=9731 RepID=UPI00293D6BA2|nr:serine/arginine repetitive matrix protein 3 [Globicephala melas]
MACTAEGRSANGRSCRHTPAANLPVRLVRESEAPGTTSSPAEMTRGLLPPKISLRSPRVRGARTTSPPPARCRAVPPPGPTAAAPGAGPPRDGGGRGARARRRRPWRRPGFQPRVGRSASQPVSQSVRCRRRECGSEGPLSGRGGGGTGCPPVERRMLRQLRRKIGKLRMLIPSGKNHLFPLTKNCIQKEREACQI